MSMYPNARPARSWPWCQAVAVRNPAARHRQCTPLELLFDLCFVVSIAALVVELHHEVVEGHVRYGATAYALLFLPICWAWMLFSWFATAYDNDDVIYRLLTLGQMAGVLALTATIPAAFDGNLVPFAVCYVLMRIPLIIKWIRAARRRIDGHSYATRFVIGLSACQLAWLMLLVLPPTSQPLFFGVLMCLELAVLPWAMATAGRQVFHAGHITERFGLFTMIVIGESIFAATTALKESFELHATGPMVVIGVATLLSAFSMWWLYFDVLNGRTVMLDQSRAFWWGHGHLLAFCAIGAMGAGAEVAVQAQLKSLTFDLPMSVAVAAPAAISVLALAWIQSVTARSAPFNTVTRMLAALLIMIAGVKAGTIGPVAATVAVAAILLLQAVIETTVQGLRLRRWEQLAPGEGQVSGYWRHRPSEDEAIETPSTPAASRTDRFPGKASGDPRRLSRSAQAWTARADRGHAGVMTGSRQPAFFVGGGPLAGHSVVEIGPDGRPPSLLRVLVTQGPLLRIEGQTLSSGMRTYGLYQLSDDSDDRFLVYEFVGEEFE